MADTLLKTKASPKWLGKQVVFIMLVAGFALWALVDATIVYPKSGLQAADFLKLQYLKEALAPGVLEKVSVEDPQAELEELHGRAPGSLSKLQKSRMDWLEALRNANRLEASRTRITDARADQKALEDRFAKADQPKALSRLDIPVQWLIFGVCGVIAAIMVFVLFRTIATVFTFDPESKTLTLPGGSPSIAPGDIELFDKRKWDKYLIFLKIKPGSHSHAGKEIKLDLLRHVPLEDWVLLMEQTAFPPAESPEGAASPSAMLMTQPDLDMPKA